MDGDFVLDPRLKADTFLLADLPLCRALLMNDCRYPWVILVPRRNGMSELYHLNEADTSQLWHESRLVSQVLMSHFRGDKLNTGALGNIVAQLHLHHIVRYQDDPAWPGPVWGHSAAQAYANEEAETLVQTLSERMLRE